jgi:uncharacterized membrane protein YhhN
VRIKDITVSKRVKNDNNWALIVVIMYVAVLCWIILPHVADPVLQVGLVVYGGVIGTMVYNSLALTTVESNLHIYLESEYRHLSDGLKKSYPGVFIKHMSLTATGVLGSLQYHTFAAFLFLVSDTVLGYTKFVSQSRPEFLILSTYFGALLLFTLSGMSDMVCTRCTCASSMGVKKG